MIRGHVPSSPQVAPPAQPSSLRRARRGRCVRCCTGSLIGLTFVSAAAANPPAKDLLQLRTSDTAISVHAGEHAPQLSTLRVGGAVWINRVPEALPEQVEIQGATRPVTWRWDRLASRTDPKQIELVYVSDSPRMQAVWRWAARASYGPLEHTVLIQNLSEDTLWLPLQPSLRFDWRVDPRVTLERFWVEKGADTPSDTGTHLDALPVGDLWQGTSSTYARPRPGTPREMIPYLLIEQPDGARAGWYLGIEFSGRTRIALERTQGSVRGEAGLDPLPGPYRTRLAPAATFAVPTVFIGASHDGADGAGNLLRRWVREVLNNPDTISDPSYPLLVNNSWGSGMAVDEALARRMIRESAALGLEMFHLDAGWFRDVGDWHADPRKFPNGIAGIAEYAHSQGLKFGLWIDWTQAGTSNAAGALSVNDSAVRDWLLADPSPGWRHSEPFKGITIDLGLPAAAAWTAKELERVVTDYRLDMLEHDGYLVAQGTTRTDHPAAPPAPATSHVYEDSGFLWASGSNDTDVSYHATRAYYRIYEQLRARHPRLLFEICNDGGRMVDFGSAAHGDYFSITDTYDPLSNRRAFFDASYVLPPAMLESYVAESPAPDIETFRYVLRSGMLGWFSLMLDSSHWTQQQHGEALAQFALYKSQLRPLIRVADLYHVSPRPDGVHWDAIEYYSGDLRRGVLFVFRGTTQQEQIQRFHLRGLVPSARYRLRFHDQGIERVLSGRALMQDGAAVTLTRPLSSELVFLEQLH